MYIDISNRYLATSHCDYTPHGGRRFLEMMMVQVNTLIQVIDTLTKVLSNRYLDTSNK